MRQVEQRWSFVYAWIVVMKPCSIVSASCSTLASGATQFVVQEAFEMIVVRLRVVVAVVDAEHDRHVRVRRRRGDDHLLRAAVEVLCGALAVGEEPGRLDHDVDAEIAPRQARRDRARERSWSSLPPTRDLARRRPRRPRRAAEHRVVLEQVRHRLRRRRGRWQRRPRSRRRAARCARKKLRPIRPNPLIPTRMAIVDLLVSRFRRSSLTASGSPAPRRA